MLLYNADIAKAEHLQTADEDEDGSDDDSSSRAFFDLRQKALHGMEAVPAYRVVSLGLLRKLRTNKQGTILYNEVEDALGRYFRLLDSDMQRFSSLHDTLQELSEQPVMRIATEAASLLKEGMREIAVMLISCGMMQRRALELKLGAQRSIAETEDEDRPLVSFEKFAEFLEDGLSTADQLRRKYTDLQQLRSKAMEKVVDAKTAMVSTGEISHMDGYSFPGKSKRADAGVTVAGTIGNIN
jgi:hypothetical protein